MSRRDFFFEGGRKGRGNSLVPNRVVKIKKDEKYLLL